MATERVDETVLTRESTPAVRESARAASRRLSTAGPRGAERADITGVSVSSLLVALFGALMVVYGAQILPSRVRGTRPEVRPLGRAARSGGGRR